MTNSNTAKKQDLIEFLDNFLKVDRMFDAETITFQRISVDLIIVQRDLYLNDLSCTIPLFRNLGFI